MNHEQKVRLTDYWILSTAITEELGAGGSFRIANVTKLSTIKKSEHH